jgi:hypothetical protein
MNADPERAAVGTAGPLEPVGPSPIVKIVMRPMTKMLNPLILKLAGRRHFRIAAQMRHAGRRLETVGGMAMRELREKPPLAVLSRWRVASPTMPGSGPRRADAPRRRRCAAVRVVRRREDLPDSPLAM